MNYNYFHEPTAAQWEEEAPLPEPTSTQLDRIWRRQILHESSATQWERNWHDRLSPQSPTEDSIHRPNGTANAGSLREHWSDIPRRLTTESHLPSFSSRELLAPQRRQLIKYKIIKINDMQCNICYNNYCINTDINIFICNHHFCCSCVDSWIIRGNKSCPLCRVTISDIDSNNIPQELLFLIERPSYIHNFISRFISSLPK